MKEKVVYVGKLFMLMFVFFGLATFPVMAEEAIVEELKDPQFSSEKITVTDTEELSVNELANTLKIGDYVTYYPNKTEFVLDMETTGADTIQKFNPSLTTEWRVLSNDGMTVELISDGPAAILTLGGFEDATRAANGYINVVKILREFSEAYVNPEYALEGSGRELGQYVPEDMPLAVRLDENGNIIDEPNMFELFDVSTYPLIYSEKYLKEPYTDQNYEDDMNLLKKNDLLGTEKTWLASRVAKTEKPRKAFSVRTFKGNEIAAEGIFYAYSNGLTVGRAETAAVRPIITLRSDISDITGDGSKANPYKFGEKALEGSDLQQKLAVGSYVIYQPSLLEYTINKSQTGNSGKALTIYPVTTINWRVLSNDGTKVEIISEESVAELTLGDGKSRTNSTVAYRNLAKVLNDISEAYVNPEFAIAGSGRGLGTADTTIETFAGKDFPMTLDETFKKGKMGSPYADSKFIQDVNVLVMHDMLPNKAVWLGSRFLENSANEAKFGARVLYTKGTVGNQTFFTEDISKATKNTYGVMPIVGLSADVEIISGDGTKENPFVVSEVKNIQVKKDKDGMTEIVLLKESACIHGGVLRNEHEWEYLDATLETHRKQCSVCSEIAEVEHCWKYREESMGYHNKECSECGFGIVSKHVYGADGKCDCGAEM